MLRDMRRAKRDVSRERPLDEAQRAEYLTDRRLSPAEQAERAEQAGMVATALDGLIAKQSRVIRLYYWEKSSLQKIADLLGCSTSSVGTLLERGLARLTKQFKPPDGG
jgi:RNA polymerase sigma factor (sigma-70 family)